MVKKLVSVFCICAYFGLAHAQIPQEIWKESEQIEKQIKKTSFPDRVYNIKDFGAKEGNNGEIFCHEAINLAILTCSQAGGGTVLVPPGEFLTGPITLKSNVNLHLEEGAYLKFSSEKYLYTPTVLTRWEGVDCYNLHPLIYTEAYLIISCRNDGHSILRLIRQMANTVNNNAFYHLGIHSILHGFQVVKTVHFHVQIFSTALKSDPQR